MRLHLFFPPFDYSVLIPELGVPLLTASARRRGLSVRQSDLNQEFIVSHLADLHAFAPLLEALDDQAAAVPRRPYDTPQALLDFMGSALVAVDGTAHRLTAPPFEHIRRQERLVDKSCHLSSRQLGEDWSRHPPEALPPLLAALARHGARDLRFRRDLLRLLHHLYFSPPSFDIESVVRAARRPDLLLSPFYEGQLQRIFGEAEPDLVGISIWSTAQLIPALKLAHAVRRVLPRALLVAGGAWCSYAQDLIVAHRELWSFFDAFALHEATHTLVELARCLDEGRDGRHLPGLITRHHPPEAPIDGGAPPPFDDTDPPDYDGFVVHPYPLDKLALRLHRGCHWARCLVCTHACHPYTQRHSFGKQTRLSTPFLAKVADHVTKVKERYGIDDFALSDNLVSPGILAQLAELNRQQGLGMTWDSLARFEPEYTPELCAQLFQGGCRRLDLGLETASDEGLRTIRKGIDRSLVLSNLRNLKRAGIGTKVFVMHYPGQPPEEYEQTLQFLVEHQPLIDEVAISRFAVARNTNAHRTAAQLPLALSEDSTLDVFAIPYRVHSGLTLDELLELTRRYFPDHW